LFCKIKSKSMFCPIIFMAFISSVEVVEKPAAVEQQSLAVFVFIGNHRRLVNEIDGILLAELLNGHPLAGGGFVWDKGGDGHD
jgi:ABC-type uncharacterized transport system substrate-binding protein